MGNERKLGIALAATIVVGEVAACVGGVPAAQRVVEQNSQSGHVTLIEPGDGSLTLGSVVCESNGTFTDGLRSIQDGPSPNDPTAAYVGVFNTETTLVEAIDTPVICVAFQITPLQHFADGAAAEQAMRDLNQELRRNVKIIDFPTSSQ